MDKYHCCYNVIDFSILFDDFVSESVGNTDINYEQVPFNHPLFIMYSSGTTGPPKCMVHSVGVSIS